jgi:hypothetical protein
MISTQRMPFKPIFKHLRVTLAAALLVGCAWPIAQAATEVQPSFLYKLSDFDGPIAFKSAQIEVDNLRNEIYVADTRQGDIRIFNANGMEVYRFGDDGSIGSLIDIAISRQGEILVLGQKSNQATLTRFDFKGRALSNVNFNSLPSEYAAFLPNQLTIWNDQLYLLDTIKLKLVVADMDGHFLKGFDIGRLIGIDEKKRANTEIGGFSVDPHGNILFTIPVMFSAFRLSPEGEILSFGSPGSAPGRFGVVGGIVADAQGYTYVADRLKSVVLIFDRNFNFQTEFGYRGRKPHNLISPGDIELDAGGRLYVSQMGNRGVSVFKITHP